MRRRCTKKTAPRGIEHACAFTEAPAVRDEKRKCSKDSSTQMAGIANTTARPHTATWLWEAAFGWKHLTTQRYELLLLAAAPVPEWR